VTTKNPEIVVDVEITYQEMVQKDKFGTPIYQYRKISLGSVDRFNNLNTEYRIPDGSIEGKIKIYESLFKSKGAGCGTLKVFKVQ